MAAVPPAYIISRRADPIFAIAMGLAAAAMRINRDEKREGKTTQETIQAAKRRFVRFIKNPE
ncbi:hypothetical protein F5X96DRAFT_665556 [Biscogniauxia mediterranea]|nr:hypothetical protein F5X96DRAFT_665556 [Biscogniauxia mediterranea]